MANGHGGRRTGSGRKPKAAAVRVLDGNANHKGRVLPHPSSTPPPAAAAPIVDEEHAPDDLSLEERRVWLNLAPLALEKGTLTPATDLAFKILCRNVVVLEEYSRSVQERGSANHRGMIQRVDAELGDFGLRAFGKASAPAAAAPAVDPVKERFFGGR